METKKLSERFLNLLIMLSTTVLAMYLIYFYVHNHTAAIITIILSLVTTYYYICHWATIVENFGPENKLRELLMTWATMLIVPNIIIVSIAGIYSISRAYSIYWPGIVVTLLILDFLFTVVIINTHRLYCPHKLSF